MLPFHTRLLRTHTREDPEQSAQNRRQTRARRLSAEEQEEQNWRRRPDAKGRTLDMSQEFMTDMANMSRAGRHPPISGRLGASPFLFMNLRGRQILPDSIDDITEEKGSLTAKSKKGIGATTIKTESCTKADTIIEDLVEQNEKHCALTNANRTQATNPPVQEKFKSQER